MRTLPDIPAQRLLLSACRNGTRTSGPHLIGLPSKGCLGTTQTTSTVDEADNAIGAATKAHHDSMPLDIAATSIPVAHQADNSETQN
jgi:hypothetical protein